MLRHATPLALLALAALAPALVFPAALVTAYRAASPPTIDGVLDEPCWQQATVCGPFVPADGGALDAVSQARVCWDDGHLYVAFECFDRFLEPALQQTDKVRAECTAHDSSVFGDDCVEIFLDLPGGTLYQLAANSIGTRWEGRNGDVSWNGEWRAAAKRLADRYLVECAVPLGTLGVASLAGQSWHANFCRERKAVEENSTWSGLQGAFNDRAQFGQLVFAPAGPAVREAAFAPADAGEWQLRMAVLAPPVADLSTSLRFFADKTSLGEQTFPLKLAEGKVKLAAAVTLPPEAVKAGQFAYEWALKGGGRDWVASPRRSVSIGLSRGQLTLTQAPGVRCQAFLDGQPLAGAELDLHDGLNLLTIVATGSGWIKPEITLGAQRLPADERWFCRTAAPPEGWQAAYVKEGFAPAQRVGQGVWAADAGARTVYFRRGLWVPSPSGRLFPGTNQVWLPAGTSQRVKPFLPRPGDLPIEGYRLCLQTPPYLSYVAADDSEGAAPRTVTKIPAGRDNVHAARYDLLPGRGLELSLRWGNAGGTVCYQPGLQAGGTFDWLHLSGTFKAPQDATLLHPLVIKWQDRGITGTFHVDNITVRRKGAKEELLKVGDFEGEEWKDSRIKPGYGKDGSKGLKIVCVPERIKVQDALWIPKEPVVHVEGGAEYVVEMDAKAENLVSDKYVPLASLLFKVADKAPVGADQMLVYFETAGGNVTEVAQPLTVHVLPPLLGVRPRHIKITPCYYGEQFSDPQVLAALADNFWRSGMIANYGSADNEVVRLLRRRGAHESIISLSYLPFGPPSKFRDLLKERPEVVALEYSGKPSVNRLCPTWLLNEAPDALQCLEDDMAARVSNGKYQGADLDVEDPVVDPPTYCFCPRCFAAFRQAAGLAADVALTPQVILREHRDAWTAFRCAQNAELVKHVRDGCKRGCPGIEFSVYSGTQSRFTQEHYGVDWRLMAPHIDLGIAGYNGPRAAIQETIKALAPVPFMGGEMYYLSATTTSGAAPNPLTWRNRLLRQCLESGGVGVLIWWLPVMDGGAFYYTSEAAAVLARHEEVFTKGQRCDGDVKVEGLPEDDWLAYRRGRERLLILMNFKDEALTPVVTLPPGWREATASDPVSGKKLPLEAPIPAYGVRVVTAKE